MSAISLFEEKQVRRAWNATAEKWYSSTNDIVLALTDSVDVKDYIKKLRKCDPELNSYRGTNCPPVEMIAAAGKKRKIKAANTESLFRIIQSIPSPKAEPFKRWLAKIGYERFGEIENCSLFTLFSMLFYAHTSKFPDGKTTNPDTATWELLFTPFGDGEVDCQQENCQSCEQMNPKHGHLNKVAYWTAKFASEMFPPGPDRDTAHQWGYLTGLWHDLGKFAPEWQTYLASKSDPHAAEITGSCGANLVC